MNLFHKLCAVALLASPIAAQAEVKSLSTKVNGKTMRYKVVLPDGYDETKTYPTILAFPSGRQDMTRVTIDLNNYWRDEAEKRGYIVISPAAIGSRLYFEDGADYIPEFMKQMKAQYPIDADNMHITGVSNGGQSAFHIAGMMAGEFRSVMALPGFFPKLSVNLTNDNYAAMRKSCYTIFTGQRDRPYKDEAATQTDKLRPLLINISHVVEPREQHLMATLQGKNSYRLFDRLEEWKTCPVMKAK